MKPRTGDFIIAAAVLFLAAAVWAYPFLGTETAGGRVEIEHDGARVRTLLLSESTAINVGGCEIRTENGEAYVADADCPDRVCVNTGKISRAGQSIICIPNKLSVKITGKGSFDALAG